MVQSELEQCKGLLNIKHTHTHTHIYILNSSSSPSSWCCIKHPTYCSKLLSMRYNNSNIYNIR